MSGPGERRVSAAKGGWVRIAATECLTLRQVVNIYYLTASTRAKRGVGNPAVFDSFWLFLKVTDGTEARPSAHLGAAPRRALRAGARPGRTSGPARSSGSQGGTVGGRE